MVVRTGIVTQDNVAWGDMIVDRGRWIVVLLADLDITVLFSCTLDLFGGEGWLGLDV